VLGWRHELSVEGAQHHVQEDQHSTNNDGQLDPKVLQQQTVMTAAAGLSRLAPQAGISQSSGTLGHAE
jgi:hypothetical protein